MFLVMVVEHNFIVMIAQIREKITQIFKVFM